MEKLKPYIIFTFAIFCAALVSSCSGETAKSEAEDESSREAVASQPENDDKAIKDVKSVHIITDEIQPEETVIVFDVSVSMKGYVDATINGPFPGVITDINNAGKESSSYLYDTKKTPIANFLSKLQHKEIKWADESDLFGMVSEIMSSAAANPNNCYALVTDGIMSGSNAEIRADRSYNISKVEILKGRIDSIIGHMPKGGDISVMVASCMAPYYGTYYCYDNTKKVLKNEYRPFYVIAAGGTAQINYMASALSKRAGVNVVQYGNIYPMGIKTNAKFIGNHKYQYDKSVGDNLSVTLNLSKMPSYARNLNYLNANLEIVKTGAKGNQSLLKPQGEDTPGDYSINLIGDKAKIVFSEKIIYMLPASFTFRLKRVQPQWVADMSTPDDKTAYRPTATLNLNYFLMPFLHMNDDEYLNNVGNATVEITKAK